MMTNTTTMTTWSIDTVEAAMAATTYTEVGYMTIGCGQATLPDAADGAPVSVSAAVALEAIRRYQGACWVDGDGHLVGWPGEGPDPEPDLGDYVVVVANMEETEK